MATNDGAEHRDSEPGSLSEKYNELERVLRSLPPASEGKENIEEYLDGKCEEEE